MATWSVDDFAANAYYELGLLGDPDGPGLEVSHLWALAGGYGVGDGWSLFAEAAADRRLGRCMRVTRRDFRRAR